MKFLLLYNNIAVHDLVKFFKSIIEVLQKQWIYMVVKPAYNNGGDRTVIRWTTLNNTFATRGVCVFFSCYKGCLLLCNFCTTKR